jgi:hypothetical protein
MAHTSVLPAHGVEMEDLRIFQDSLIWSCGLT